MQPHRLLQQQQGANQQRRLQQARLVLGRVDAGTGPAEFLRYTGAASGVNPPANITISKGGHFYNNVRAENGSTIIFGGQDNSIKNSNNTNTTTTNTNTNTTSNTTTGGGLGAGFKTVKINPTGKKRTVMPHEVIDMTGSSEAVEAVHERTHAAKGKTFTAEERSYWLEAASKFQAPPFGKHEMGMSKWESYDHINQTFAGAPCSRSLHEWDSALGKDEVRDGREACPDFEAAVLDKLFTDGLDAIIEAGGLDKSDADVAREVQSILYTYSMVQTACQETRKEYPFNDPVAYVRYERLQRAKFTNPFVKGFLERTCFSRHKMHSKNIAGLRPSDDAIRTRQRAIQARIQKLPPGTPVLNADETCVIVQAPLLHKYVKVGTKQKADDNADEKVRVSDMACGSDGGGSGQGGDTLPAFITIKCFAQGADLSKTTVLNDLQQQLNALHSGRFELGMWIRTLALPSRKSGSTTDVTFKIPYIIDKETGAVITVHHKAWMDRVRFIMWSELVLKPWVDKHSASGKALLVVDNCSTHKGKLVEEYLEKLGIFIDFLSENCTTFLQVMDLLFNGPLKTHLRMERCPLIFKAFQKYKLVRQVHKEAAAKAQKTSTDGNAMDIDVQPVKETPRFIMPIASQAEVVLSVIGFHDKKNKDPQYRMSLRRSFVNTGISLDDDGQYKLFNARDVASRVDAHGDKDNEAAFDATDRVMPPQLVTSLLVSARAGAIDYDSDDDLENYGVGTGGGGSSSSSNNSSSSSSSSNKRARVEPVLSADDERDIKYVSTPALLSEDEIETIARGNAIDAKTALHAEMNLRAVKYQANNQVKTLVKHLKAHEAKRLAMKDRLIKIGALPPVPENDLILYQIRGDGWCLLNGCLAGVDKETGDEAVMILAADIMDLILGPRGETKVLGLSAEVIALEGDSIRSVLEARLRADPLRVYSEAAGTTVLETVDIERFNVLSRSGKIDLGGGNEVAPVWHEAGLLGFAMAELLDAEIVVLRSTNKTIIETYKTKERHAQTIYLCYRVGGALTVHYDLFRLNGAAPLPRPLRQWQDKICFCQTVWDEDEVNVSVECDTKPECPHHKHYHLKCLKVSKASLDLLDEWYCPPCVVASFSR